MADRPLPSSPSRSQKWTLLFDRFMNHFIKVGGVGIIVAVLAIFLFILWQIIPLFQSAEVSILNTVQTPYKDYSILAMDEWGEKPLLVSKDYKKAFFYDLQSKETQFINWPEKEIILEEPALKEETLSDSGINNNTLITKVKEPLPISHISYLPNFQSLLVGTKNGEFVKGDISYKIAFDKNNNKTLKSEVNFASLYSFKEKGKLIDLRYGESDDYSLVLALQENENQEAQVKLLELLQKRTLMGSSSITLGQEFNLNPLLDDKPETILIAYDTSSIVISDSRGTVYYIQYNGDQPKLIQKFIPFPESKIASMEFILGSVSLSLISDSGENQIYSLFLPENKNRRIFSKTKDFQKIEGELIDFDQSLRNKSFLLASTKKIQLFYTTSESLRWERNLEKEIQKVALSRKYHRIAVLDTNGLLEIYKLNDPHPQSGLKAFFTKIWYEGFSEPEYIWQSTGGTDSFEPKLSLIPLIIGTLKGTFYALIFAIPIALLAAIYTSQFLDPRFKSIVKPTMEIMASLPSVILGFLAALWLAPLIETKVPSLLLTVIMIPLGTYLFAEFWSALPLKYRLWLPKGYESFLLLPFLAIVTILSWNLGPILESLLFTVTDPQTGKTIADFRLWWPQVTGLAYEQRNSLVVGFIMGFAVIPIIFTITEDSLSAVPLNLRSASLALGASRWQTTIRVVLPTASAGIFSAIMIGFGRAVGETMIVLMATGNTPIMDFNIFSGMRTLSANLAVELPEAPFQGTLYRTLFLGAFILFMMTFIVNTFAESLRQYLREKYKTL